MTGTRWLRFRWYAGADGVAHALPNPARGWSIQTACGLPASCVRLALAEWSRCAACGEALGFSDQEPDPDPDDEEELP